MKEKILNFRKKYNIIFDTSVFVTSIISIIGVVIYVGSAFEYGTLNLKELIIKNEECFIDIQKRKKDYIDKRDRLFKLSDKDGIPGLSDLEIIDLYSRIGYDTIWNYGPFFGRMDMDVPCYFNINGSNFNSVCPIESLEKALESYQINTDLKMKDVELSDNVKNSYENINLSF